jgi:hypothetical protein
MCERGPYGIRKQFAEENGNGYKGVHEDYRVIQALFLRIVVFVFIHGDHPFSPFHETRKEIIAGCVLFM